MACYIVFMDSFQSNMTNIGGNRQNSSSSSKSYPLSYSAYAKNLEAETNAKDQEKRNHFTTLLPNVIDEIFKKIGVKSVLKRNTTFKTSEDLFSKISGIVKMDENDYYEVLFNTTKNKVDIDDFKNMNNWTIKFYVSDSKIRTSKLFENNKNINFSDYKTII